MEIILSPHCRSFTGTLSRRYGYAICKRGNGFYSQRNSRNVPPDGHLQFILACAQMAKDGLLFTDIRVSREEMIAALAEAGAWNDEMIGEISSLNDPLRLNDVIQLMREE